MGKLIPIILLLIGTGAGIGVGIALAPEPPDCAALAEAGEELPEDCAEEPAKEEAEDGEEDDAEGEGDEAAVAEFVRMNDQFVIPVLEDGTVKSLVVLSITLEVEAGASAAMFAIEPKLRDTFLRILFDHANTGGFAGNYTEADRVERLRAAIFEGARKAGGSSITDVLILDLLRQEV